VSNQKSAIATDLRVMTVCGPVNPDDLGITLSHDHILLDAWGMTPKYENYSLILDDEEVLTAEVMKYRAAGGGTICDPTNEGIGRNPEGLARISRATGVHIVMGAGWYRERVYPEYVYRDTPNQLADRLIRELAVGVDGTGVRPGFIGELGTERGHITPAEERVFRAAARAHRRTGCPIMTHTTHWGELALEQLDLLEEEGVDPRRVIISHLGDRPGVKWLLPIAVRGAWIDVDNLAFSDYAPLAVRADNVVALWEAGHGHQIMLSNDICRIDQLSFYGGCGYGNVIENFLPLLEQRGLGQAEIAAMTQSNPARAFAYSPQAAERAYREMLEARGTPQG
jgi:phosphotriesterase-related protein